MHAHADISEDEENPLPSLKFLLNPFSFQAAGCMIWGIGNLEFSDREMLLQADRERTFHNIGFDVYPLQHVNYSEWQVDACSNLFKAVSQNT